MQAAINGTPNRIWQVGSVWRFLPTPLLSFQLPTRPLLGASQQHRQLLIHRITECSGLAGTSVGHPAQPPAQAGSPTAGCTGPRPGGSICPHPPRCWLDFMVRIKQGNPLSHRFSSTLSLAFLLHITPPKTFVQAADPPSNTRSAAHEEL